MYKIVHCIYKLRVNSSTGTLLKKKHKNNKEEGCLVKCLSNITFDMIHIYARCLEE